MPRYIVKLNNFYFEWSTVVDAPVTFGMPIEEFKEYYQEEYGLSGVNELPDRLKRVERKGVSAYDYESAESLISVNRAGPEETDLPTREIKQAFCDRIPIVVKNHKWDPVDGRWDLLHDQ